MIPVKLSFFRGRDLVWDIVDKFLQFFFLVDVVLTFFTPYYENNNIITSYKKIAWNYISSLKFFVDVISIFPYDLLVDQTDPKRPIYMRLASIPMLYRIVIFLNKNFIDKISKFVQRSKDKKKLKYFPSKIFQHFSI